MTAACIVLQISGLGGEAKPTSLWIDAGIHAREWISPAVAEYFIERVSDYTVTCTLFEGAGVSEANYTMTCTYTSLREEW